MFEYDTGADLRDVWARLRRRHPNVRSREAALALGISEAELLATRCGDDVTRLTPSWTELVGDLSTLGPVVATTRNTYAVQRQGGAYGPSVRRVDDRTLVLDGEVELSCDFGHWHSGFAVHGAEHTRLEFFGRDGAPVHTVRLDVGARAEEQAALIDAYASDDQLSPERVSPLPTPSRRRADTDVDLVGLRTGWERLANAHALPGLLDRFCVSLLQGLRLVGHPFSYALPRASLERLFGLITADALPVVVVVENAGAAQRYRGLIASVSTSRRWLHVRERGFTLQLRTDRIASTWVVRLPTRDGMITVVDAFDTRGNLIVEVLGAADRPGDPVATRWDRLVATLGASPDDV